jgi:hypothetical protein
MFVIGICDLESRHSRDAESFYDNPKLVASKQTGRPFFSSGLPGCLPGLSARDCHVKAFPRSLTDGVGWMILLRIVKLVASFSLIIDIFLLVARSA